MVDYLVFFRGDLFLRVKGKNIFSWEKLLGVLSPTNLADSANYLKFLALLDILLTEDLSTFSFHECGGNKRIAIISVIKVFIYLSIYIS